MTSHPMTPLKDRIRSWPVCCDGQASDGGFAAFCKVARAEHPSLAAALDEPATKKLVSGIFAYSPYLTSLIERDPSRFLAILTNPPDVTFEHARSALETAMADAATLEQAKPLLRDFKSTVALLTAVTDIGGVWSVMDVTRALSQAADHAVATAVRFLFRLACVAGQWQSPDPSKAEDGSGYFVLAMGKQGAFELNYSSDIDLIVFFDRDKSRLSDDTDLQTFLVRLTRNLVMLLEERTADGYVFRTDLRLRPDAGATQMALSTSAAFNYYETVGQNWERAAMIKARVCAGDLEAGDSFLAELTPYIWRKYLDFAQIADVHAMKRQIHAHKGYREIAILGQDLKLGHGGIREIEFFAQTQQLIAGGRQVELRVRGTLDALAALVDRGWVKPKVHDELVFAYLFLRRLEHRLQMIADEQTHSMPKDQEGLENIAGFSGFDSVDDFSAELRGVLETVQRHYADLFEDAPALSKAGTNMVFAGATDDPATHQELLKLGFSQPQQVMKLVRGWHHGRVRAVQSAKGRALLTEVQPALIVALAATADPDAAIAEFDRFLTQLPAGVQLFSLLKANPNLLGLLAEIMGSTPRLARILSTHRQLLDAVLDPLVIASDITPAAINSAIEEAFTSGDTAGSDGHVQDILDTARRVGHEQAFLIGIGVLTGSISAAEAGLAYATVADALIARLLQDMQRHLEAESGTVPGGAVVVVGMGKLGGHEMTASSDVDLLLIYDFDTDAVQSTGAKPLAPTQYYARLTQRLINAMSAPTAQGTLFDVDMRLRPSGQKGPLATRFSSFVSYQNTEAWTWEHLALTRARVIAGDAGLRERVETVIRSCLRRPRDTARIAADVKDMRDRIASEKGSINVWDLKHHVGGLVDLEFTAQYLQLINAADHPEVLDQGTLEALRRLAKVGILSSADAQALQAGGRILHDLNQILRLSVDGQFDPAKAPDGLKKLLVRASGVADFAALEIQLGAHQAAIRRVFEAVIQCGLGGDGKMP